MALDGVKSTFDGVELLEHAVQPASAVAKTIVTSQQQKPLAIPRGATIAAVDGVEVSSFYDVARELKKNAGQRITIDWRIDEQNAGDAVIEVEKNEKIAEVRALTKQAVPFRQLERL